jgi:hypothetical protein
LKSKRKFTNRFSKTNKELEDYAQIVSAWFKITFAKYELFDILD